MSDIAKRSLVKAIRKLISRLSMSDLSNAELYSAVPTLLGKLREIDDQPTHSKWYLQERKEEVEKFEELYFRTNTLFSKRKRNSSVPIRTIPVGNIRPKSQESTGKTRKTS
jgi:hypothetical protein